MRLLAGLLMCLTGLFALQGCAGFAVSESGSSVERKSAAVPPMTIRTLTTEHRFTQISTATVAQQLRALHAGESLNILAISGGGSGGAFGAGAVAGLTRSGSRPDFAVVTGVSAGALVAPYAFLGPTWDARLLDAFTSEAGDNLRQTRGLGAIFGSSFYRGTPLRRLVEAYVSDSMIEAVSREANRGRLLLVATTDVATGQPVVWDLGSIAMNGGPSARTLFCDVLVASASVPGMFPPVMIRVHEEAEEEAHVDGGATVPFFVPPAFVQAPSEGSGGAHAAAVYVIIDGPLAEAARTTRLTARGVLSRSIDAGLNHLLLTTLELTAATAQLQGATLRYSAVPAAYPYLDAFDFRAATRRPLFHYAYQCAQEGRLWAEIRRTESDEATSDSVAQLPNVPCPSDDPFIGYFALNDRY
jgi:predicted acylesterase/phospholipase RssA